MADQLAVHLHGTPIGVVTRAARTADIEQVRLRLDTTTPDAVRLTESFAGIPGQTLAPHLVSSFLGGYTPEGNQRRALASKHGLNPRDLFALLARFGGSIAGALTFTPDDEQRVEKPAYESLTQSDLGRLLRQAVDEHDLALRDDSRSMIQGFQPKALLARFSESGPWLQPHGRAHSTHIVKPQLSSRPHAIYDEFYSHQLARYMGLSSFASDIGLVGQTAFLAIQRFDRVVNDDQVRLVHQEDAAQAIGLDWVDDEVKFQDPAQPSSPRRASADKIATMIASLDEDAMEGWIRQLTYRVLIGDNDGHAKNVGILHTPGRDTLADIYDAVPNLYQQGRITWDMALALDGEFDHRRMSVARIVNEVDSWGVMGTGRIENLVTETVHAFGEALEAVPAPAEATPGMLAGLRWNIERLSAGNEINEPKGRG